MANLNPVSLLESSSSLSDVHSDEVPEEVDFDVPAVLRSRTDRFSVAAESYGDYDPNSEMVIPTIQKTKADTNIIIATLKSCFLFQHRDRADFEVLVPAFIEVKLPKGEQFITEGEEGDCMYVLVEGEVDVFKEGEGKVNLMKPGTLVGEVALMYDTLRAGTCVTASECRLMKLTREVFINLVKHAASRKYREKEQFVSCVPLFAELSTYDKHTVVAAVMERFYEADTVVVRQGESGDEMYFVADGELIATKSEEGEVMRYKAGDYFGELALLDKQSRRATVKTTGAVKLLVLEKKAFYQIAPKVARELKRQRRKYHLTC